MILKKLWKRLPKLQDGNLTLMDKLVIQRKLFNVELLQVKVLQVQMSHLAHLTLLRLIP